jgi:hydrogenase expression/formation protein HypE
MKEKERVKLSHGAGGSTEETLIHELFLNIFENRKTMNGIGLDALDDGASIKVENTEVIVSIDGHTVDPIFFPGGDIGRLAISGAVNDISVMGAEPVAILDAIICEEGFPLENLRKIIASMNYTAKEAGVAIIAGDFKVMPKGSLDNLVVATTGIGILKGKRILDSNAKPGDKIIVTGPIGDHGISLMSHREGLEFRTELKSDVSPIYPIIKAAMDSGEIRAMKDLTRGGLAMALNEIAVKSNASIELEANNIPIRESVKVASDMLGLDPYEVTCEGRAVIITPEDSANIVLESIRGITNGEMAEIIGDVKEERPGIVLLRTLVGGTRILRKPMGEPIPRVC